MDRVGLKIISMLQNGLYPRKTTPFGYRRDKNKKLLKLYWCDKLITFIFENFIKLKDFSLIHGDLHTSNILVRGEELLFFDQNSLVFSGDRIFDLSTILIDIDDTLFTGRKSEHINSLWLNSFIEGYGEDFLSHPNITAYVVFIAFERLHRPHSDYYRDSRPYPQRQKK